MPNEVAKVQDELSDDILWGVPAIARFIGKPLTKTEYLVRTGQLPVGRLGPKTIIGSKRQITRRLNKTD
jgi:hypothetical protein